MNSGNIESIWRQLLDNLEEFVAEYALNYESVAISAPNCLAVTLDSFYKEKCEAPAIKQQFENKFAEITNQQFRIDFLATANRPMAEKKPIISKRQKMKELEQHPLVRKAIETFDGEITDVRGRGN